MSLKLTFLGGVGTVTGSKYLLDTDEKRLLVDCGLFQGYKNLRLRNWAPLPVDPKSIDAVILTHAHLDHSGYIPLRVKNGFSGSVVCTEATRDLCAILLPDSGHLQEKDAEFANRHKLSKHHPALPLYSLRDAEASLERFSSIAFGKGKQLAPQIQMRFLPAGHILGAAIVELTCQGTKIVFSGDLGRPTAQRWSIRRRSGTPTTFSSNLLTVIDSTILKILRTHWRTSSIGPLDVVVRF